MITITRAGAYARHTAPFSMDRPWGNAGYLLLLIQTNALFHINGTDYTVTPGSILVLEPRIPYSYDSVDKMYIDDWMHFECSLGEMDDFPRDYINKPLPLSGNPQLLIYMRQVVWEFSYSTASLREKNINMLMTIILNHIKEEIKLIETGRVSVPYEGKLKEMRMEIEANPCTVEEIDEYAKILGISSSYFQHLYTKLFGISFREDVIEMKLAYARGLLIETKLSVEEVAYQSGYNNEVHFFRQFKSKMNMTPAAFRKKYMN